MTDEAMPQGPRIKVSDIKFWPVKWIYNEEFWKNIVVNVYSAAVVAIFSLTLIEVARQTEQGIEPQILVPITLGFVAIVVPPLAIALPYLVRVDKDAPLEERRTRLWVTVVIVLMAVVGMSWVLVRSITNIING